MQFRQHYARADEQNANFDHYFWHKSKVFVEENGPLSSVNFIKSFIRFNRNTIYVIAKNLKIALATMKDIVNWHNWTTSQIDSFH